MAKNDNSLDESQAEVKAPQNRNLNAPASQKSVMILSCVVVGVIVLLVGIGIGWGITSSRHGRTTANTAPKVSALGRRGRGLNSANNSGSRLLGVVTSVNGSSFTLAGNGTTETINTNSQTTYTGGTSVATNDSVLVDYTGSGSNLTASHITIRNQKSIQ